MISSREELYLYYAPKSLEGSKIFGILGR